MKENYEIRKMRPDEVQIAIDWALEQGWNPGLNDAKCFYQADPNGFFVGLLNNEPIATGSAVIYGDSFAFCGLYIVKQEYRGQGFGLKLTEERLKYVGNRLTGLDGVIDKVDKYKRLGYVEAHRSLRFRLKEKATGRSSTKVINLQTIPFSVLNAYDQKYFPGFREPFLREWISQPQVIALGYLNNGSFEGYGVARRCFSGYKIGPLFAETPAIAHILFEAFINAIDEGPIFLDCPEPNHEALNLVNSYKMDIQFEVIRMYRNGNPKLNLNNIYGITTFELG